MGNLHKDGGVHSSNAILPKCFCLTLQLWNLIHDSPRLGILALFQQPLSTHAQSANCHLQTLRLI